MAHGFIRSKEEVKYLILYIAGRLIAPVPFEVLQELTMCDPAVDFFEFSECLSYLVDTEHMTRSTDELYAITERGIQNGRACQDELPYSVRLTADKLTEEQNQKIRRSRQVQSSIVPRSGGVFSVILCFNGERGGSLWRTEVTVPDRVKAKDLVRRFEEAPEKMYSDMIRLLFPQK